MGENEKRRERRGDDPTRWVRAACDVMAVLWGVGGMEFEAETGILFALEIRGYGVKGMIVGLLTARSLML